MSVIVNLAAERARRSIDRARQSSQRHDRLDNARNVRARLRVLVKRILRKYGYPPDKQERVSAGAGGASVSRLGRRVRSIR